MTGAGDWDDDPYEPDDSDDQYGPDYDDDPQDGYEPDPEDGDIARSYEEYYEHCDKVHGGGECDCRPSLRDRLAGAVRRAGNARVRIVIAMRGIYTVRIGRAELTLRLNADRACGACGGKGWAYSLDRSRTDDRPPGYNGVGLCGCGSAIGKLAESRRHVRSTRGEPPF